MTVRVPVRVPVCSRLCIECSPYRGRRPADATPTANRLSPGIGGMRTCWFLGGGTRVARARGRPTRTGRGALLYLSLGSFPAQAKTAHPYRRPNGSTDRWPSSTGRSILTIRYYCYRPRPPTATVEYSHTTALRKQGRLPLLELLPLFLASAQSLVWFLSDYY